MYMANATRLTIVRGDSNELTFNRVNPQTDQYAATIISPLPFYSPAVLSNIKMPPICELLSRLGIEDFRGIMSVRLLTHRLEPCPESEATHLYIVLQGKDPKATQALYSTSADYKLVWSNDLSNGRKAWLFELGGALRDWHRHFCAYLARSRHLSELHCENLVKVLCARGYRFCYKSDDGRQVLDFHRANPDREQATEYKAGLVRPQDLLDNVGRSLAFAVDCEESGKDPQTVLRERAAKLM